MIRGQRSQLTCIEVQARQGHSVSAATINHVQHRAALIEVDRTGREHVLHWNLGKLMPSSTGGRHKHFTAAVGREPSRQADLVIVVRKKTEEAVVGLHERALAGGDAYSIDGVVLGIVIVQTHKNLERELMADMLNSRFHRVLINRPRRRRCDGSQRFSLPCRKIHNMDNGAPAHFVLNV